MTKATSSTSRVSVVIPNWNGALSLGKCIESLLTQSLRPHIIMVDNGSVDNSIELVQKSYPEVEIVRHDHNRGYAGGVNAGFRLALGREYDYVAPFNNDAIADKDWLRHLVEFLDNSSTYGIAACKLLSNDGSHLDSSGEEYSVWGLPYPRGRGETKSDAYDERTELFAASGGASLYRIAMLKQIGLLDEDFFAYYEDVDLSFRAQLYGWKVGFVPQSHSYHEIGMTGGRIKGFFTYQTIKNLPWLLWKNVPASLIWHILPRFAMAYLLFIGRAFQRGHGWYALKGLTASLGLLPKKLLERHHIQQARKQHGVDSNYIWSRIVHDLPPDARALRKLRRYWQTFRGSRNAGS